MPKLTLVNGDQAGRVFYLEPTKTLTLGRESDCEILVANVAGVSRHHARFSFENGNWVAVDLNSQNGIYCNNQKVGRHLLKDQDVLWFSNAALRFESSNEAAAPGVVISAPAPLPPSAAAASEKTVPELSRGAATAKGRAATPPSPGGATMQAPAAQPEPLPAAAPAPAGAPAIVSAPAPADPAELARVAEVGRTRVRIEEEFSKVIVGQKVVLDQLLVALLSSGHCLMIGLPGLAKTLMVSTLSQILDLRFKRIQFTPDLMPSDIIGSDVLDVDEDTGKKSFRFIQGPIFTNMLLADEINRTPPKTQAALLEAMQERQVTASNQRMPLPAPFFVLATQNPLEQEGTYPLPEAQLDRFMFNITVEYPTEAEEEQVVMETTRHKKVQVDKVISGEELLNLQRTVRELPVSPYVVRYATRLVRSTRPKESYAPDYVRQFVSCGAGPRAAQFLILGAKSRAVLEGRINVTCDDVRSLAQPVLRHRIFTNFTADSEGVSPDDLVKRLLLNVAEPKADEF